MHVKDIGAFAMGQNGCTSGFNRRQIGKAVKGMGICPRFPAVGGLVFHEGTFEHIAGACSLRWEYFSPEEFKAGLTGGKLPLVALWRRTGPGPCTIGHCKPTGVGHVFWRSVARAHLFHRPSLSRRENHVIAKVIMGLRSACPPGKAGPGSLDSRSKRLALPAMASASTKPAKPARAIPWPE